MEDQHISVLLQEVLDAFSGCKIGVFVDGTLGAGGHAKAILQEHPEITRYIDWGRAQWCQLKRNLLILIEFH